MNDDVLNLSGTVTGDTIAVNTGELDLSGTTLGTGNVVTLSGSSEVAISSAITSGSANVDGLAIDGIAVGDIISLGGVPTAVSYSGGVLTFTVNGVTNTLSVPAVSGVNGFTISGDTLVASATATVNTYNGNTLTAGTEGSPLVLQGYTTSAETTAATTADGAGGGTLDLTGASSGQTITVNDDVLNASGTVTGDSISVNTGELNLSGTTLGTGNVVTLSGSSEVALSSAITNGSATVDGLTIDGIAVGDIISLGGAPTNVSYNGGVLTFTVGGHTDTLSVPVAGGVNGFNIVGDTLVATATTNLTTYNGNTQTVTNPGGTLNIQGYTTSAETTVASAADGTGGGTLNLVGNGSQTISVNDDVLNLSGTVAGDTIGVNNGELDLTGTTLGTGDVVTLSGSSEVALSSAITNGSATVDGLTIDGIAVGDIISLGGAPTNVSYNGGVLTFTVGGHTDTLSVPLTAGVTGFAISGDELIATCYCRGTNILTQAGEVAVEDLKIGDLLITKSGAARAIRWIGRSSYAGRFAASNRKVLPVLIKAGALADQVPARDLYVSPAHAMFLDGVLIPATALINGSSIMQLASVDLVEYFHVELESHDVIIAEGALSESFVDDDSRNIFHNVAEYRALHPEAVSTPAQFCAPIVEDGEQLEAVRAQIAARVAGVRRAA